MKAIYFIILTSVRYKKVVLNFEKRDIFGNFVC